MKNYNWTFCDCSACVFGQNVYSLKVRGCVAPNLSVDTVERRPSSVQRLSPSRFKREISRVFSKRTKNYWQQEIYCGANYSAPLWIFLQFENLHSELTNCIYWMYYWDYCNSALDCLKLVFFSVNLKCFWIIFKLRWICDNQVNISGEFNIENFINYFSVKHQHNTNLIVPFKLRFQILIEMSCTSTWNNLTVAINLNLVRTIFMYKYILNFFQAKLTRVDIS